MKWKLGAGIAAMVAAICFANPANAAADLTLSLTNVSTNNPNAAAFGGQLSVEVMDIGTGVQFNVINAGPIDSTIANAYFGGTGMALLNTTTGVVIPANWGLGSAPPQLPSGSFTASFAADADAPPPHNGIQANENGIFQFNYAAGANFAQLLTAINGGNVNIGFHVISIDEDGFSDSYETNTPPGEVVPIPAPFGLAALGFGIVALRRRKGKIAA